MQSLATKVKIDGLAHVLVFTTVAVTASQALGWTNATWTGSSFGLALVITGTVAMVYLATRKTTWLPFLGTAVIPPSVLLPTVPSNATMSARVTVNPKASGVVYWAAEADARDNVHPDPYTAYMPWTNTGMVPVSNGQASLPLECPRAYKVRTGKVLPKHVHYREVHKDGVMGPVRTQNLSC